MATIIDGKQLALEIRSQVRLDVVKLVEKYGKIPHLTVILIGEDPASQTYVSGKEKACQYAGIKSSIIHKDDSISEMELLNLIDDLNANNDVDGILLQLPIPKHLDADKIISKILPEKDVDGFTPINVAKLAMGHPGLVPCTPLGIMRLLEKYHIEIEGKHCVVIGRSQIVGKPMASLLLKANGTVTVCHSRTKELNKVAQLGDILVVAIGKPNLVDKTYIKEGAVVIDVGTSRVDGKLTGDVFFESAKEKAGFITPVPGGVGPMTIACLLENTLTCYRYLRGEKQ